VIAPLLGSILYAIGGITVPFYTFAVIFFIISLIVFKIIPEKADQMQTQEQDIRVERADGGSSDAMFSPH
jgi:hypothetical protein